MSTFDLKSLVGEIDVLRSDEYANLPGASMVSIPMDQRNTVIHEVLHMVFAIPVTEGSQGGGHVGVAVAVSVRAAPRPCRISGTYETLRQAR
jgi:hypothetical protein